MPDVNFGNLVYRQVFLIREYNNTVSRNIIQGNESMECTCGWQSVISSYCVYTIPVTSLGVNQCYVQIVRDFKCIKVRHYCTHAQLELYTIHMIIWWTLQTGVPSLC